MKRVRVYRHRAAERLRSSAVSGWVVVLAEVGYLGLCLFLADRVEVVVSEGLEGKR